MNPPQQDLPPLAPDRTQLRAQLDAISRAGAQCLRSWRWKVALREAACWSPLWLGAVPLVVLLARVIGILDGAPLSLRTMAGLTLAGSANMWNVGATLAGPLFYIVGRVGWSVVQYQPLRAATLALHDRNLETKDRLVIADEFLGSAELTTDAAHSAFMRAAVDDARECASAALATPLPPLPVPGWTIQRASWWGVPVAALLILLGRVAIGPGALAQPAAGKPLPLVADASPVAKLADNANLNNRRAPRPPAEAEPAAPDEKSAASTPQMPRRAKKEQPMDGQPASGGGAQANSSNSGTRSAGLASSQRSKPNEKKPEMAKTEEPEEKESAAAKPKPRKKKDTGQLAMDSNSGQGKSSSSSSNLNPFEAPEQPDKSGLDPKADAEDDGDQDEDEQEKTTGVNKPMDDTKAPAVDRNLSTQPPGDGPPGNGRGGPGELKKTRGVPSMILGIPIPDRVPGTPSPGRSKVTQEYTRPKEESHPQLEALSHTTRTGAVGHIEQPDLLPWRRSLVESYFISVRQRAEDGADPTDAPAPVPPKK